MQADISAGQMIDSCKGSNPERRKFLEELLDIDRSWRMHKVWRRSVCQIFELTVWVQVSDGQRRRVLAEQLGGAQRLPVHRRESPLQRDPHPPAPATWLALKLGRLGAK